jgi:hypothetical protein
MNDRGLTAENLAMDHELKRIEEDMHRGKRKRL